MSSISNAATRRKRVGAMLWTLRSFAALVALAAVLALSGAAFEAIASSRDAAAPPPAGRLVDVGGFQLHLHCMGEGIPTVVLDAGLGRESLDWSLVQPDVARTTRVCAYDRAGMGWSDPSPHQRTPAAVARELHALLDNAGVSGPYVLAAHSLSGKYARMFAVRYPREVAGVVLVDARHEYVDAFTTPDENQAFFDAVDAQGETYAWARRLGVVRMFGSSLAGTPAFPAATRRAMALIATRAAAITATSAEARQRAANDAELEASSLGDHPLIVLAAGESMTGIPHWSEAQRRQAALSSRGELRVAQGSSHCIQCDDPELVTRAIEEIVATVRFQR